MDIISIDGFLVFQEREEIHAQQHGHVQEHHHNEEDTKDRRNSILQALKQLLYDRKMFHNPVESQ